MKVNELAKKVYEIATDCGDRKNLDFVVKKIVDNLKRLGIPNDVYSLYDFKHVISSDLDIDRSTLNRLWLIPSVFKALREKGYQVDDGEDDEIEPLVDIEYAGDVAEDVEDEGEDEDEGDVTEDFADEGDLEDEDEGDLEDDGDDTEDIDDEGDVTEEDDYDEYFFDEILTEIRSVRGAIQINTLIQFVQTLLFFFIIAYAYSIQDPVKGKARSFKEYFISIKGYFIPIKEYLNVFKECLLPINENFIVIKENIAQKVDKLADLSIDAVYWSYDLFSRSIDKIKGIA